MLCASQWPGWRGGPQERINSEVLSVGSLVPCRQRWPCEHGHLWLPLGTAGLHWGLSPAHPICLDLLLPLGPPSPPAHLLPLHPPAPPGPTRSSCTHRLPLHPPAPPAPTRSPCTHPLPLHPLAPPGPTRSPGPTPSVSGTDSPGSSLANPYPTVTSAGKKGSCSREKWEVGKKTSQLPRGKTHQPGTGPCPRLARATASWKSLCGLWGRGCRGPWGRRAQLTGEAASLGLQAGIR